MTLTIDDGNYTNSTTRNNLVVVSKIMRVPSEYPTIADAINSAGMGDYIYLAPGIYDENVTLPGEINGQTGEITKNNIHIVYQENEKLGFVGFPKET